MSNLTTFQAPLGLQLLQAGEVGVIPTDTLYGVVAAALNPAAVERVYRLKGRSLHKPCIILLDSPDKIAQFGVAANEIAAVQQYWPGQLSVIFSHMSDKFSYLTRDLGLPPFRVPANQELRDFLAQTGPLIAPSANMQGQSPAETIQEAQSIFGNKVSFYIDGGRLHGEPSTIVKVQPSGELRLIRQGALDVSKLSLR